MDVGLFPPLGNGNANAEILRTLGREAEDRGFESIWVAEHVVMFDEYESQYPYADNGRFPGGSDTGLLEPLTALTYLAAVTDRIRLGTGICLVPQRNPVYTAKQVVDLDNLSGGRVDFGIGVGWLKEEFDVVAAPFDQRGARTDEYLQVMRTLWTDDVSSFDGEHYQLPDVPAVPEADPDARTRRSTSAARATPRSAGSPSTVRAGTRSTASPRTSTSRWPASTTSSPPRAATRADITAHGVPVPPGARRRGHRGLPGEGRRPPRGPLPRLRPRHARRASSTPSPPPSSNQVALDRPGWRSGW